MVSVLHLLWQPDPHENFLQMGGFRLWMETSRPAEAKANAPHGHPRQLGAKALAEWVRKVLNQPVPAASLELLDIPLPTANGRPLPCPELLPEGEGELPEQAEWGVWTVACCRLADAPMQTINELHYRLLFLGGEVRPGQDFLQDDSPFEPSRSHKFLTLGTLEERIDQMIEDKKKVAGAVVGNDESWLAQLDNEAFKKLIALNRAAVLDD